VDPTVERRFHATMRNDFLTPRGTPYKWQEMTASLHRTVIPGRMPTMVPVRYQWERVDVRTGDPRTATDPREWTFARGQSFAWMLNADAESPSAVTEPATGAPVTLDVSYPQLPKSPAVDLLLMLSWDVVGFEMMCTHLGTTPDLRDVGDRAELERISGSWAELQFSDPGAVAVFRNARMTAECLGHGRFAGRPSTVYSSRCLDCVLDVRSGPTTQRGRSSYWVTLQLDVETGDLLCAEMTEMIVATLTGMDGHSVPVQKRRTVRMWADAPAEDARGPVAIPAQRSPVPAVPAVPAEAIRLAERIADHLTWQIDALRYLPQGMAELALMGFRSVAGHGLADTDTQVRSLLTGLRAMADGEPGADAAVRQALPEHRRCLEGLLAFGQIAVDGQTRLLAPDEADRKATLERLNAVGADLTELLTQLERLERLSPAPLHHPTVN
jgi:hypothetical protein